MLMRFGTHLVPHFGGLRDVEDGQPCAVVEPNEHIRGNVVV